MTGNAPDHLHDPGGKVRLRLPDGVIGGATFSACGRYRQALTRDWTPEGEAARAVLFVGMNPSVAGAEVLYTLKDVFFHGIQMDKRKTAYCKLYSSVGEKDDESEVKTSRR